MTRPASAAALPDIETTFIESVPETAADAGRVIRDFADQGYDVIVTTSFGYMQPTFDVAADFPDTVFIHISGYMTAENMGTAFGKIEEPRYVSGLIAGKMTTAKVLGYVAAFPIPEVLRGINAFTLGVRKSAPDATVKVVFTSTWYDPPIERAAADALLDAGVDVVAQHQDTAGPQQAAQERGKYGVGYNADMAPLAPEAVLTCPVWNWGVFYTQTVQQVIDGSWVTSQYWGGWQDGVVDLSPIGPMVPDDVKAMAATEVEAFKSGEQTIFTIFTGPLVDQAGEERIAEGTAMTAEELLSMDWLVEGVEAEIPD